MAHLLPSAAGRLLEREVSTLRAILEDPRRPLVAVIGGAKVTDKIGVIERFLTIADAVLIGGAMCFPFLAALGHTSARRCASPESSSPRAHALDAGRQDGRARLELPSDLVIATSFSADAPTRGRSTASTCRTAGWASTSVRPRPRATVARSRAAGTVFWNGPMGAFELEPFAAGTRAVADAVADSPATTVVGGGDSAAALHAFGLADRVDHLSTGGGATLELIEGRPLPGVAVLEDVAGGRQREARVSRTPLIAGNWKMHKTVAEAEAFIQGLLPRVSAVEGVDVAICVPFTSLGPMVDSARGSRVEVYAQNMHQAPEGAFTGEISAPMLSELDVHGVVLGHSERRQLFGETDRALAAKVPAALAAGLAPILCVGETEEEREAGDTERTLRHQVSEDLSGVDARAARRHRRRLRAGVGDRHRQRGHPRAGAGVDRLHPCAHRRSRPRGGGPDPDPLRRQRQPGQRRGAARAARRRRSARRRARRSIPRASPRSSTPPGSRAH